MVTREQVYLKVDPICETDRGIELCLFKHNSTSHAKDIFCRLSADEAGELATKLLALLLRQAKSSGCGCSCGED